LLNKINKTWKTGIACKIRYLLLELDLPVRAGLAGDGTSNGTAFLTNFAGKAGSHKPDQLAQARPTRTIQTNSHKPDQLAQARPTLASKGGYHKVIIIYL
jgi:hypothetical protein